VIGIGGWRALALAAGAVASAALGCGAGEEVANGATVTVYAEASLCAGAKQARSEAGGRAGDLRVRVTCLSPIRSAGKLDLATVGANARRATEDSTAVAFIESPDRQAARFTHPILDSADLGWTTSSSGAPAMHHVLRAITEADSSSLRGDVRETLEAE
jgi:hypothetical protein